MSHGTEVIRQLDVASGAVRIVANTNNVIRALIECVKSTQYGYDGVSRKIIELQLFTRNTVWIPLTNRVLNEVSRTPPPRKTLATKFVRKIRRNPRRRRGITERRDTIKGEYVQVSEVFRRTNTIPCPELRRNRLTVFSRVFDDLFLRTRTFTMHASSTGKAHGSESLWELIKGLRCVVQLLVRCEAIDVKIRCVYRCVHVYRAHSTARSFAIERLSTFQNQTLKTSDGRLSFDGQGYSTRVKKCFFPFKNNQRCRNSCPCRAIVLYSKWVVCMQVHQLNNIVFRKNY